MIRMPPKRKPNMGKPHRGNLTQWADLDEDERQRFLRAFGEPKAQAARTRHTFLGLDDQKTHLACLLACGEQIQRKIGRVLFKKLKGAQSSMSFGRVPAPPQVAGLLREYVYAYPNYFDDNGVPKTAHSALHVIREVVADELRMFIDTRNWQALEWLAEFVRKHPNADFPVPDDDTKLNRRPFLRDVILLVFIRLTGTRMFSLNTSEHPCPKNLPTKRFLREMVERERGGSMDKKCFYTALRELGLSGLPEAKSGPAEATRREAASARARYTAV